MTFINSSKPSIYSFWQKYKAKNIWTAELSSRLFEVTCSTYSVQVPTLKIRHRSFGHYAHYSRSILSYKKKTTVHREHIPSRVESKQRKFSLLYSPYSHMYAKYSVVIAHQQNLPFSQLLFWHIREIFQILLPFWGSAKKNYFHLAWFHFKKQQKKKISSSTCSGVHLSPT